LEINPNWLKPQPVRAYSVDLLILARCLHNHSKLVAASGKKRVRMHEKPKWRIHEKRRIDCNDASCPSQFPASGSAVISNHSTRRFCRAAERTVRGIGIVERFARDDSGTVRPYRTHESHHR
jgi:hypothetical protein